MIILADSSVMIFLFDNIVVTLYYIEIFFTLYTILFTFFIDKFFIGAQINNLHVSFPFLIINNECHHSVVKRGRG